MTDQQRNPLEEYREQVRLLTQPHAVVVDGRDGALLGYRTESALLLKLAAAVQSNLGASHGSGSAGNERTPINVGAADLLARITGRLQAQQEFLTGDASRPRADVALLRVQLALSNRFFAGTLSVLTLDRNTRQLATWVQQIRDLLDPPHRYGLRSPCPSCGAAMIAVADEHGHAVMMHALQVTERHEAEASSVVCQGCGLGWHGVAGARRLSMSLDAAAADRADTGPIDLATSA